MQEFEASSTNRIQVIEGRISDVEDTVEEMDTLFKENTKSKNTQDTKHLGNLELREKAKSKDNRNRGRRRKPVQRPRKNFQQNYRRKFP